MVRPFTRASKASVAAKPVSVLERITTWTQFACAHPMPTILLAALPFWA